MLWRRRTHQLGKQREYEERSDEGFVELARRVYRGNAGAPRVKRQLDELTGSVVIAEKSYRKP